MSETWGPYCKACGHPATYHGTSFCMVRAGAENKKPCDCTKYEPALEDATDELREAVELLAWWSDDSDLANSDDAIIAMNTAIPAFLARHQHLLPVPRMEQP